MALTRQKKEKIVENLKSDVENQKIMIFAGFKGIKNKNLLDLRKELKSASAKILVAKKTLMKIVFQKEKINIEDGFFKGETAIIFGFNDEIAPAKKVFEFTKNNPEIEIIGGFLNNEIKTNQEIIELAKIASREELLARLIGSIQAPISGFNNVLHGNIKGLINVLSSIKK